MIGLLTKTVLDVLESLLNGHRKAELESAGMYVKGYWVVDMIRIDIIGIPNSKEETPHE